MDEAGEFVYVFVGEGDTASCPVAGFMLRVFAVDHDEAAQRRFPRRSQAEQGCGADTQASERGNGDFPTRAAHVGGGRVAQTQSRMKAALAIDGDDAIASLGRTPSPSLILGPFGQKPSETGQENTVLPVSPSTNVRRRAAFSIRIMVLSCARHGRRRKSRILVSKERVDGFAVLKISSCALSNHGCGADMNARQAARPVSCRSIAQRLSVQEKFTVWS